MNATQILNAIPELTRSRLEAKKANLQRYDQAPKELRERENSRSLNEVIATLNTLEECGVLSHNDSKTLMFWFEKRTILKKSFRQFSLSQSVECRFRQFPFAAFTYEAPIIHVLK